MRVGVVGAIVWVLVITSVLAAPTQAMRSRTGDITEHLDPEDDAYVIGYLTWNGVGGISWEEDPKTVDPGGSQGPQPAADNFESAPFPRTVFYNASRFFHLDLAHRTAASGAPNCANRISLRLNVELYANNRFIGGTTDGGYVSYAFGSRPADPPGYQICRYRFALEAPVIEKGAILRLRLVYMSDVGPYEYGMAEPHASVIRVPHYGPDEAFSRVPKEIRAAYAGTQLVTHQAALEGVKRIVDGDEAPSKAGIPLGLLVAASLSRRRGARGLALAIAVMLAGCAGKPASTEGVDPSAGPGRASSTLEDDDVGLTTRGFGTILGQVHDDVGAPLGGAFLSVLHTRHATRADPFGAFRIPDVTPGQYTVNVDHVEHHSVQAQVDVAAGKVTSLDVTMVPIVPKESDDRYHHHDYWDNKSSKEVWNGTWLECAPLPSFSSQPCSGSSQKFLEPSEADRNLVMPGTIAIDVILDWDPEYVWYKRIGVAVQANNDAAYFNWTAFYPRGPREVFHIQTNREMNDVGHQFFSTWYFELYAVGDDQFSDQERQSANTAHAGSAGLIYATIVLHKGVVPLEPPHPDHWGGTANVSLYDSNSPQSHYSAPSFTKVVTDDVFFFTGQSCLLDQTPVPLYGAFNHAAFSPGPPGRVVPQGTKWIDARLTTNRPPGTPGVSTFHWTLSYKPGNFPAYGTGGPGWRTAGTGDVGPDGSQHWNLTLAEEEPDGVYAKKSTWAFYLAPDNPRAACLDLHTQGAVKPLKAAWQASAYRGS